MEENATNEELDTLTYYDVNGKKINVNRKGFKTSEENEFKKPDNYDDLVEIARELSKPFPFVRVDLYDVDEKIYFGEFTFIPSCGLAKYENNDTDNKLGELLNL